MEQRELKFRSAHYNHDGTFNGFTYWGLLDVFDRHTSDCFASPTWRYGTIRKVEEQYTGLKDKNGKEIYEGDIVKTDFKQDGSHESIQVIEFYEGAFGSRNKDDHFRIPALFSGRSTEGMNTNYYEIIGNIHQNPELLKGDQQNG